MIGSRIVDEDRLPKGTSLWDDAWARLKKNRLALVCMGIFTLVALSCFFATFFSPYGYEEQNLKNAYSPPSAEHWMGTDDKGRDLATRIFVGGRVSLFVGFLATAVSLVIGVLYGATSAFVGGKTEDVMMRIVEILYSLPYIIIVILLTVSFGRNIYLLFIAIGAVEWLTMARIVRGQVLSIKKLEFVEAATSQGHSSTYIILRHVIPNVLGPVIVYATLTVPAAMLLEAVLSYLGLGVQPPQPSWGTLINEGAKAMEVYPWLLLFPALFFSVTMFCLNILGDGLRDALDPKASKD